MIPGSIQKAGAGQMAGPTGETGAAGRTIHPTQIFATVKVGFGISGQGRKICEVERVGKESQSVIHLKNHRIPQSVILISSRDFILNE
jgi:hypothetical protein